MRTRVTVELWMAVGLGLAGLLHASAARADDQTAHRFGLVLGTGGGVAGLTASGPLPGLIAFTDLAAELKLEFRPWGGFLRADYLSSGNGARWHGWSFSTGAEYRLFGSVRKTALFLRGGVTYQRWMGDDTSCAVDVFVPNSCNLEGAPAPSFSMTADMVGLVGGVRVELPIKVLYLAFGANLVPVVAVDGSSPTGGVELGLTMDVGFRDTRATASVDVPRRPGRAYSPNADPTLDGN
jgi:hypothetical protein